MVDFNSTCDVGVNRFHHKRNQKRFSYGFIIKRSERYWLWSFHCSFFRNKECQKWNFKVLHFFVLRFCYGDFVVCFSQKRKKKLKAKFGHLSNGIDEINTWPYYCALHCARSLHISNNLFQTENLKFFVKWLA